VASLSGKRLSGVMAAGDRLIHRVCPLEPVRNGTNVDSDRRRELLTDYGLHRLSEEIKVGKLESCKRDMWIAMTKPLIPLFFHPIIGKDSREKCFDADRRLVRCSRITCS
jgi:hypothetical protein